MASLHSGLFLREEALRHGTELLMVAGRDTARTSAPLLHREGVGQAHQRALFFIAQEPGLTVGALLGRLDITKQSLSRVVADCVKHGWIEQTKGRDDARQRHLWLTDAGRAFEKSLFGRQRERLIHAYRTAGAEAVAGFWQVLALLVDGNDRARLMARFDPR